MYKILNKCSLGDIKSVLSKTLLFFFLLPKTKHLMTHMYSQFFITELV